MIADLLGDLVAEIVARIPVPASPRPPAPRAPRGPALADPLVRAVLMAFPGSVVVDVREAAESSGKKNVRGSSGDMEPTPETTLQN